MNKSEVLKALFNVLEEKFVTTKTMYHNGQFLMRGSIVEVVSKRRFFRTLKFTKCGFPVKNTDLKRIYNSGITLHEVKHLENVINHNELIAVLFTIYGNEHLITFNESFEVITLPKIIHNVLLFNMIWKQADKN